MQSVIAIIIIELMYLLGVFGETLAWVEGGALCLTEALRGTRAVRGVTYGPAVGTWTGASRRRLRRRRPTDVMDTVQFV